MVGLPDMRLVKGLKSWVTTPGPLLLILGKCNSIKHNESTFYC